MFYYTGRFSKDKVRNVKKKKQTQLPPPNIGRFSSSGMFHTQRYVDFLSETHSSRLLVQVYKQNRLTLVKYLFLLCTLCYFHADTVTFPIKWAKQGGYKGATVSQVSPSACVVCLRQNLTSVGYPQKLHRVRCSMMLVCVPNLHCRGEIKVNNLVWSARWQSISRSLLAAAWLEGSC